MTLVSEKNAYKLDELIKLKIILEAAGRRITGVDVYLKYDPKILEPQKYLKTESSSFDVFPYLKVDALSGTIIFSALTLPKEDARGRGEVAELAFKPLKRGQTRVKLLFTPGSSRDSNAAFLGKDILEKAHELEFKID